MACKLVRVGRRWGFTREFSISSSISISISHSFLQEEEEKRSIVCATDTASAFSRLHLYASCLRECTNSKDLAHGRIIHTLIITCGFARNTLLCNLLLQLYGCCLSIEDANATFCTMPRRNLLSFNYMLSAHLHIGDAFSSIQIFQHMQLQGVVPNKITFIIMLSVCAHDALTGERFLDYNLYGRESEREDRVQNLAQGGACVCFFIRLGFWTLIDLVSRARHTGPSSMHSWAAPLADFIYGSWAYGGSSQGRPLAVSYSVYPFLDAPGGTMRTIV